MRYSGPLDTGVTVSSQIKLDSSHGTSNVIGQCSLRAVRARTANSHFELKLRVEY
jgi:hypothetical protein